MKSVFYPWCLDLYQKLPGDIINAIDQLPSDRLQLFYSEEHIENLDALIDAADSQLHRTVWVLQPSHPYTSAQLDRLSGHLEVFDKDVLRLYFYNEYCAPITSWTGDRQRFLFLTGKPARYNRIRLLHRLYTDGLLDNCDWSLAMTPQDFDRCRDLLLELTADQYRDFVSRHIRDLDPVHRLRFTDELHYCGYPYDPGIYQQVDFRVICETEMTGSPVITEKTWQTMINRRPFIMVGYPHSLRWLESQGYKVFREYLAVPDYDDIIDRDQRLEAVVINIKHWLDTMAHDRDRLFKDIQHNVSLLTASFQCNLLALQRLRNRLDPQRSLLSIFPLDVEHDLWLRFYQRIRDPRWPDCWLPERFETLPLQIQKECREVFGYQNIRDRGSNVIQ